MNVGSPFVASNAATQMVLDLVMTGIPVEANLELHTE
jgi:hypothetical protein